MTQGNRASWGPWGRPDEQIEWERYKTVLAGKAGHPCPDCKESEWWIPISHNRKNEWGEEGEGRPQRGSRAPSAEYEETDRASPPKRQEQSPSHRGALRVSGLAPRAVQEN